jgi:hypothetical protein
VRVAIYVLVIAGCGGKKHASTIEHHGGLVEDAFLDTWRSDYAHPFQASTELAERTASAVRRCSAGNDRACYAGGPHTSTQLAGRCRAGHHMSCRALRAEESDLPGNVGRTTGCASRRLDRCELVRLWNECIEGFPRSCKTISDVLVDLGLPLVPAPFAARARGLSESGCRAGIGHECALVDERLHATVLCRDDAWCAPLAHLALDDGDPARARRLLEHGCQLGEVETCRQLGIAYLHKHLTEPVEGRGQKLVEWACQKTASVASEPAWAYEQCVREAQ